jgi:enhancer of yellow 2 transcription factor
MPVAETELSLYTQLRQSLVESGEWDQYVFLATWLVCPGLMRLWIRIQSVMRARLNEMGWIDEVKSESKGNVHVSLITPW